LKPLSSVYCLAGRSIYSFIGEHYIGGDRL
jgi:hypothetical protein